MKLHKHQDGFSLIIALVLLTTLTVLGLSIMRSGILSEKQATNIQEKSVSFHGAQSSNNGVIESYRYDKDLLASALEAEDKGVSTCIDFNGKITEKCANPTPIDSANGVLKAQSDTFYKNCLGALKCTGNSSGMFSQNTVGCNVFQHDAVGWVDADGDGVEDSNEAKTEIEQWSLLVSACANKG